MYLLANISNISIDLDVDATNQHDELVEKHGTDGEDNCILEVLDLLEDCCETVMSTALLKNLRFAQNE
jgi:hypothetical protein